MKTLQGFQGIFFDKDVEQELIKLQLQGLCCNIENMHITFHFGDIEKYPDHLMGEEFTIMLVGYASDGKNSGFSVILPDELKEFYNNSSTPHITVSIGEVDGVKGEPIDTAKLDFRSMKQSVEIQGRLGYLIFGKGKYMDNAIFHDVW